MENPKLFRLVSAVTHDIHGEFARESEARETAMRAHWRGPVEVQERHEVEGESEDGFVWKLTWRKE